jgi:hypothetical protein
LFQSEILSPIIIIGMHRSGTTLVSQLLNEAGVHQGVFRDHNSEAFHFLSINQQVLGNSGSSWLEPKIPEEQNWFKISAKDLYQIHFQNASPRFSAGTKWGWKDPRNTFTLSMYLKMFPNAKVIHVIRNGMDVALSLKSRNGVLNEPEIKDLDSLAFNFNLWEKYIEQGESNRKLGDRFLAVKYEDLLNNPSTELQRMSRFCSTTVQDKNGLIRPYKPKCYSPELKAIAGQSAIYNKWYTI